MRSLSLLPALASLIALSACSGTPPQQSNATPPETPTTSSAGEGESSSAAKDVDYMTKLGLMKGHLMVAQELIEQGKPQEAEPHIGHPVEEIYADVEAQLQTRNVQDFKPTLTRAEDLVTSKPNDPQLKPAVEAAIAAVDQAIQAVPAAQRQSPEFVLQVMNGVLDTAKEEYEAAIADGKIVEAIEYQDSRGFVLYADSLFQEVSTQLAQTNSSAKQEIESSITEVKKAWPSAIPPETPVMTPEQVSQQIETIETNATKVSS